MAYATVGSESLSIESERFTRGPCIRLVLVFSRRRDFTVPFSKRADQSARFATRRFGEGGLLFWRVHRNRAGEMIPLKQPAVLRAFSSKLIKRVTSPASQTTPIISGFLVLRV